MNTNIISGIYQIRNLINNKIYVGSSVNLNRRKAKHFDFLQKNKHTNSKIQNSYNKHSAENFVFEIIEYVGDLTKLIEREQHYIDTLKPWYNLSPTAGNNLGIKHTLEARQNMSKAKKGSFQSEEAKLRRKGTNLGRKHSEESKRKMSESQKNGSRSIEQRHKISETLKGTKHALEARQNMSKAKLGKPLSEKHKLSLIEAKKHKSVYNKGKKLTEEQKLKLREIRLINKLKKTNII